MRHITLQALAWGTVTAAVSSALWLAATEPGAEAPRRLAKASHAAVPRAHDSVSLRPVSARPAELRATETAPRAETLTR